MVKEGNTSKAVSQSLTMPKIWRGLRTTRYFLLLLLPLISWILLWVVGRALDSMFSSYEEWSIYSQQYFAYRQKRIMLILGLSSLPFIVALYIPIVKAFKRHLKENSSRKTALK